MLARAHHEALERDDHLALRRRVVRLQPRIREHGLRRRVGQQHRDVVFPVVDLDDARDLDVADLPGAHGFDGHRSPPLARSSSPISPCDRSAPAPAFPKIRSDAFSAIATTLAFVFAPTRRG